MHVTFIRHGESTGNAGIPSFDLANLELTATGQAQAEQLAVGWTTAPTLIAVSPYLRTQLTAAPTIKRFPDVPVVTLPMEEFTYLEPGRWNGTSRNERLPFIEAYWSRGDPAYRDGPGAESFDTLLGRVGKTLVQLQAYPDDAQVDAFSHGQFMQALRLVLLFPQWSARQAMAHFWPFSTRHPIRNADRLELQFTQGRWSTPAVDDVLAAQSIADAGSRLPRVLASIERNSTLASASGAT